MSEWRDERRPEVECRGLMMRGGSSRQGSLSWSARGCFFKFGGRGGGGGGERLGGVRVEVYGCRGGWETSRSVLVAGGGGYEVVESALMVCMYSHVCNSWFYKKGSLHLEFPKFTSNAVIDILSVDLGEECRRCSFQLMWGGR